MEVVEEQLAPPLVVKLWQAKVEQLEEQGGKLEQQQQLQVVGVEEEAEVVEVLLLHQMEEAVEAEVLHLYYLGEEVGELDDDVTYVEVFPLGLCWEVWPEPEKSFKTKY